MLRTFARRTSFVYVLAFGLLVVTACSGRGEGFDAETGGGAAVQARLAAESDVTTVMEVAELEAIGGDFHSAERACSLLSGSDQSLREWAVEATSTIDPDSADAMIVRLVDDLRSADRWSVVGEDGVSPVWPNAGVMFSHGDGTVTLAIDADTGAVTVSASSGCYGGAEA